MKGVFLTNQVKSDATLEELDIQDVTWADGEGLEDDSGETMTTE